MLKLPVSVPSTVGVKVTLTWQLAPEAKLPGQSFACAKSPAVTTLVTGSVFVLVLVIVIVWGAEPMYNG